MKDPNTPAAEQLAVRENTAAALFRQATDVAHLCREIVLKCVVEIAGRRYVKVEGWMSIAVAHGCIASIKSVENIPGEGVKAVAEVKRINDQAVLATAEGFVGVDEPDWYGGEVTRWNKKKNREETKTLPKRTNHAIRAMSQTRSISRVLRAGFSHVVVMIDEKLSTVPYEEISGTEEPEDDDDGKKHHHPERINPDGNPKAPAAAGAATTAAATGTTAAAGEKPPITVPRDEVIGLRAQFEGGKWEPVAIHFGAKKDTKLGELAEKDLKWWCDTWHPKPFGNKPIPKEDLLLRAALDVAKVEGIKGGD